MGQICMCHVKTHENIETEGTSTADTSEPRYFAKDTDVGEHRLMYAPIFLCTDRVFLLFLTTYHFCHVLPCSKADLLSSTQNTHSWHDLPLFEREIRDGPCPRRLMTGCCMRPFPFHRSSVSSVFDDLSFLPRCCPALKADLLFCIPQHTQLARPSSFRERNTGALHCEIPKWTSKKFELATKVLSLMLSCIQSYILSFHTILDSFLFTRS